MISMGARVALSTIGREERREAAKRFNCEDEVMAHWGNNGKICGQCQHFSQIGKRGSGLNGSCQAVAKSDYTKPEEQACSKFKRVVNDG